MIQHVWERCRMARELDDLVVATDHAGIAACVRSLLDSDPEADVVVVADNCTDQTRQRAAEAGHNVRITYVELDETDREIEGLPVLIALRGWEQPCVELAHQWQRLQQ